MMGSPTMINKVAAGSKVTPHDDLEDAAPNHIEKSDSVEVSQSVHRGPEGPPHDRERLWLPVLSIAIIILVVTLSVTFVDRDSNKDEETNFIITRAPPTYNWSDHCPEKIDVSFTCSATVGGIQELHEDLGFPEHFDYDYEWQGTTLQDYPPQEGDFDVGTYFEVLNHTFLPEGYHLGYIYCNDGMGGNPILFVHKENSEELIATTLSQLAAQKEEYNLDSQCPSVSSDLYLKELIVEDSPQGYMELVTMKVMGDQFYLYWHAGYNDDELICNEEQAQYIIQHTNACTDSEEGIGCFQANATDVAHSIDWTPTVECDDGLVANDDDDVFFVKVRIAVFSKWGGFSWRTYTISREPNNQKILDIYHQRGERLIPYDIGIAF